jgi:catechol 2,3-dioxygenase-like lactoylglutathione lyase family enzyme
MIDHIGFPVADYRRSREFYAKALAPLGFGAILEVTRDETGGYEGTGFGADGKPSFWIGTGDAPHGSLHVAFPAKSRLDVDLFYAAAIASGGRDNGAPGLRPDYSPDYYAAFVLDPDGNNVEAVCRAAQ